MPAGPRASPLAALGANARRRISVGLERRRDGHTRRGGRPPCSRRRRARLGRRGALRAARPDRRRRSRGRCLLCSPYKFYGPHLGLAYVRRELAESWRPYKVRPAPDEPVAGRFETGTLAHELLAGFVAAVEYLDDVGWDFIQEHERALGQQFIDGLPDRWRLHGPPGMEGRVPTFAVNHESLSPRAAATRLAERGFAVWDGNYYAVEIMKRLGLPDGAVRVGIVHYNTADEVDRLLEELSRAS